MTKDNDADKSNLTDSEILEQLKGKKVRDIINSSNLEFFDWLKNIPKLETSRTIEISTFLINFSIALNFFPWFNALFFSFPMIKDKYSLTDGLLTEFKEGSERLFSIFALCNLKYESKDKYTKRYTDQKIDDLWRYGPLIQIFFTLNSLPLDMDIMQGLKISRELVIIGRLFPNLNFDPEFQKIIDSKAFKMLFDTSFIHDFFQKGIYKPRDIYPIPPHVYKEAMEARQDKNKRVISINPELKISLLLKNDLNYYGTLFLGSLQQIDEIITLLVKYYTDKIPSKKNEIEKHLLCFGELLKLTEGKSLQKLSWAQIKKKLTLSVNNKFVEEFMEYAFLESQYQKFDDNYEHFKGKKFLQEYHDFLKKVGYLYFGNVSTGVFLVWRGLIKYLETLHREKEFWTTKGKLLEKWCYEKAFKKGFRPEKLILINSKANPTEKYIEMLAQTKDFPRRLQLKAEFPEGDISYFKEIDLAIYVNEYLLAFECKGTSAPIGEMGNIFGWIDNLDENYLLLSNKIGILENNIKKGTIQHPFLKGVKQFILIQIQTEGIFAPYYTITIEGYLKFLDDLRNNTQNTLNLLLQLNVSK